MRRVMSMAGVLGGVATVRSFGILYLGNVVFHLDVDTLRTLVYLNLSIGGHLTLFAARTLGSFWSIKPAPILLAAVFGTQAAATLIAVNGVLMVPLSWHLAGVVWGYCAIVFLIQDRVKLVAYKIFSKESSGFLAKEFEK